MDVKNQQQATLVVNDILNEMVRLGVASGTEPLFLPGAGRLVAEPHPEWAEYWRAAWRPGDERLRPLDLDEFSVEVSAAQIARYRSKH